MNKVYRNQNDTECLTASELADEANKIYPAGSGRFTAEDFGGKSGREQGEGHGYCGNFCEFVLFPVDDPCVIEGKKRYMRCCKCGAISHL